MRIKDAALPVAHICQHGYWPVGIMSVGACLHVLWARYLRLDLDMVRALSATARCSLLSQNFNFCSLSTFPQVIARGMAVNVGDIYSWPTSQTIEGSQAQSEGCIEGSQANSE